MPSSVIEYTERIVSFIDILGFKKMIDKMETDHSLHHRIHWALNYIQTYKTNSSDKRTVLGNLEVSVFSDCIVISSAKYSDLAAYHRVIWASGWLQAQLLGVGVLTRGGISIGKTYHSHDLLYGKGILNAYNIENKAAVYPRVVLDPKISNNIPANYKSIFLEYDSDSLWYIDPFSFPATAGNSDELLEDGWDPHEVFFDELGKHIEIGIKEAKKIDHFAKWTWLQTKYNTARANYLKTRETKLTLLMKFEESKS